MNCFLLFASLDDLNIHRLAGKCSFTLTMPGNRSSGIVALPAESVEMLLESICQDLDCGSVYYVNKSSNPPIATCFHDCDYADLGLQNCSWTERSDCTVITEAVCGEAPSLIFFLIVYECIFNITSTWMAATMKECMYVFMHMYGHYQTKAFHLCLWPLTLQFLTQGIKIMYERTCNYVENNKSEK